MSVPLLLGRRHGVGVFVIPTTPQPAGRADVLTALREARSAVDRPNFWAASTT